MGELWFRVRDFFKYSAREKRDLMIAIGIITFIFAFNDGRETFELVPWLMNFILTAFFVFLTLFVHTAAQKVFGLQQGLEAEFKAWPAGLVIGLLISIASGGHVFALFYGGVVFHNMTIFRLGRWRYGENTTAKGLVASTGVIANLVLATIALTFSAKLNIMPEFFGKLATINFWIIVFSLLPLPRMDGLHLFFYSRLTYVFISSTLIAYILMTFAGIYSWVFAFVVGCISWLLFYLYVESA